MEKQGMGKRTIIMLGIAVLLIGGLYGAAKLYERFWVKPQEEKLQENAALLKSSLWTDENTLVIDGDEFGFDHRLETFLFIGTDNSGGEPIGDSGKTRQPMADFLLLMILDHTQNSIGYLQIDRNTITRVWELNAKGEAINSRRIQICSAFWYGSTPEEGAENTVRAVREYLGDLDKIDGYYVMNMNDLGLLNRSVGGVEIQVDREVLEWNPGLQEGGTYVMTDEQAEAYLRARSGVGEGTNAERMARQRNYITGLFSQVGKNAAQDPGYALELWNMLRSAACTNMNGNDFSRIAQKLIKGENKGIHVIQGETREGYASGDGELHEEFYPDYASLKAEMTELFSLIPVEDAEDEAGDGEDAEDVEDDDEDDEDDIPVPYDGDEEDEELDPDEEWIPDEEDEEE